ncbi:hypothetical protein LIER_16149 [Lithospermum erythrorhizon]|uniref:Uncharacterized protein n=1 Tax=Lithospermum erythrorhizon TaxID=34254 RepID=A0AAV3Q6H7_LITER
MNTMGKVLDNMPQPALTVNTIEQVIHGLANLQGATSGTGPSKIKNTWQVNKAGFGRGGVSILGETTTQKMSRRGNSTDFVVGQDCAITNVVQIVQLSNDSVEPTKTIDRPAELVTAGQGCSADTVAARKTGQSQEEHSITVHQLLMPAENAWQLVEQDGTTDEEQSRGPVIVDDQHEMSTTTALLGIPSKAIAQVAEKMAEIHGDSSSVGFSTPEKELGFKSVKKMGIERIKIEKFIGRNNFSVLANQGKDSTDKIDDAGVGSSDGFSEQVGIWLPKVQEIKGRHGDNGNVGP